MTRPDLARRGSRPVVRMRPSAAFLAAMSRGECLCALIDAKDRPCLTCNAKQAIADRSREVIEASEHAAAIPWWRDFKAGEAFTLAGAVVILVLVALSQILSWGAP